jgi:hypothetical protein
MILRLLVAVVVFWLAFDGATYGLVSRNSLAIAVWWVIILGLALGLLPRGRPTRESIIGGGLLAGFAGLTVASMAWAASAERAFTEFNRVTLYLGVFVLAAFLANRANVSQVAEGIAIGVAAIGTLALASRSFPALFPRGDLAEFLPSAQTRLSYPLNYWNGLAIFVALGVPLLLSAAVTAARTWVRGLAVAPLPALVAVIYLASSRGGFVVAIVGAILFLATTGRRWAAAGATAVALVGSGGAIAILIPRQELVNGPLDSAAARTQGWQAAVLITLVCAASGIVYALGARHASRVVHPGPLAGRIASASVLVLALVGIAASDPLERFETFKEPPGALAEPQSDFVRAHLLSGSGSGRWQFWGAAVDQFERNPVVGDGAGSYEAWWLEQRPISLFVKDAHSLYLEVLGELGVIGFLFLAGVIVLGGLVATRRLIHAEGEERVTFAALAAAFGAYAVGVGIDWMWELTVVSLIGVVILALLTGAASASASAPGRPSNGSMSTGGRTRSRARLAAGIGLLLAAWLVVCAQAIPLLSELKLRDSEAAVKRDDAEAALSDARAARALEPWAASPYLQLALVQEHVGDLDSARDSIRKAVARDSRDWRLWLVAARLETKLGFIPEARASLARAATLNPRSPLFAGLDSGG